VATHKVRACKRTYEYLFRSMRTLSFLLDRALCNSLAAAVAKFCGSPATGHGTTHEQIAHRLAA
jgi:hypothetical protein